MGIDDGAVGAGIRLRDRRASNCEPHEYPRSMSARECVSGREPVPSICGDSGAVHAELGVEERWSKKTRDLPV